MSMKVDRITLVRAAEEHYHHHQTKLKNLTNQTTTGCSPVQLLLAWHLRSLPGSSRQTLIPEGDALGMV